ncbi:MAG: hypothetical protein ABIE74_01000 [Pseudomonadota bacterium]
MSRIKCPVCGSSEVKKQVCSETSMLTAGPNFSYEQDIYLCKTCGEQGDFALVNDSKFLEAYKTAQIVSMKNMIETLTNIQGISMAFFERAFELPTRTLTRWKNGEFSATALALLRTVYTYPWIAQVAASKFNDRIAKTTLLREGLHLINRTIEGAKGLTGEFLIESNSSGITGIFEFQRKEKPTIYQIGEHEKEENIKYEA